MKKLLLFLALTLQAAAQTTNVAPLPTFIFAGGVGSALHTPGSNEATVTLGVGTGGTYAITTLDFFRTSTAIREGVAKVVARHGAFTLLTRADAGVSTGANVAGSFSGGLLGTYNLSPHTFVYGEVRLSGTTATIQSKFTTNLYFGIGWDF